VGRVKREAVPQCGIGLSAICAIYPE